MTKHTQFHEYNDYPDAAYRSPQLNELYWEGDVAMLREPFELIEKELEKLGVDWHLGFVMKEYADIVQYYYHGFTRKNLRGDVDFDSGKFYLPSIYNTYELATEDPYRCCEYFFVLDSKESVTLLRMIE